uniref:Transforming acidic coiled-coil-containing protein C-terminal domain-containing protein n=1 Tax=Salarias fasciatus TaxID=181472 RepID=A0A672IIL7_SALFA
MSSDVVNDENRGFCPRGKRNSSSSSSSCSSSDDIFSLDQPTGRPSILRQTENLSSNAVPKGMKVCFQTPRRDPVTKRILSPSKSVRMSSLDECTKPSSFPEEDMPIQTKGSYQLDFDNLDAVDPFQGSNKMALSPAKPAVRASYKAEVSANQAQLRREQLKAQSLENSLDQKEKEVEELTKLCDELISKVQKR